jgi:hypothetical protein
VEVDHDTSSRESRQKESLDLLDAGETSPTPSALRTTSYLLESQALRQHQLARQSSGSE